MHHKKRKTNRTTPSKRLSTDGGTSLRRSSGQDKVSVPNDHSIQIEIVSKNFLVIHFKTLYSEYVLNLSESLQHGKRNKLDESY